MRDSVQHSDPLLRQWLREPETVLRELDRVDCAESLAAFVKQAWHVVEPSAELKWGWSLDAICEHLEAVHYGQILELLINVPPGCMKSLLAGVMFPAWEWGPKGRPDLRFLGTSHKQDLATRDNLKCRRLIQSRWYQERWPLVLTSDQNAKTKFENDRTGFREAMPFKSMTGSRGDRVLLDDPLSVDDAKSEAELLSAELTFTESLPTRLNNERSAKIVIMQRLHERDTSGVILSRDLGYVHLMLPMEFESSRQCKTVIGFEDPRTKDGELLFPERFPAEQVEGLKRVMGDYAVAGQFQQRPAPRGGAIFKTGYFQKFAGNPPEMAFRIIVADTAMKTKEENDYSVFEHWGVGKVDRRPYLLGLVRGKWEAPELETVARAFWQSAWALPSHIHGPLRSMIVEDAVSGTGLIQKLERERIPVWGIKRTKDKIERAHDVTPYLAVNPIMLPEDAEWVPAYLAEMLSFPRGAHDDQVDPTIDAIKELLAGPAPMDMWV